MWASAITPSVASAVSVAPTGGIGATDVQAALGELDAEKAPKDSPVFAGAVAIGTNPAQSGVLRLPNAGWLTARDADNTADVNLVRLTNTNQIQFGTGLGAMIGTTNAEKLAFYGATPVAQPAGTPAAATDLDTAVALVNDLRAKLMTIGLIA